MRISDWSSDVCSSDLPEALAQQVQRQRGAGFLADGDPAQHRTLVHHLVLDQAEVLEAHTSAGVGLFRRVLRGADPRDPGLEFEPETREDRQSTRLNSRHQSDSRMPSSASNNKTTYRQKGH